jgi:hypothetical protein
MDKIERDVDAVWPRCDKSERDYPDFPDDEGGFQDWLTYVLEGVFYHVPLPMSDLEGFVDLGAIGWPPRIPHDAVNEMLDKLGYHPW